ncbi:Lactoylglutathione lyase [Hibiscus syriacus]|uniref:Lactoylglutathione lyase n=1 Tax=Hibiscus syriacus TaxID=106335 RepID=A0A6A3BCK8_HIBSY|nr:Lactoylglutathione lyase [Hibiscus syriacus]
MASSGSKESAANNPGLQAPPQVTKGYFMQQTCFRIKDPKISLDFYSRILGMSLLKRIDVAELKFTLYFMGYEDVSTAPSDRIDRTVWTFSKPATIELTQIPPGNSEPLGFGHIGITVDDTFKACERFASLGVEFAKTPEDGFAFIKDPDGYWIEIFDLVRIRDVVKDVA